MLEFKIIPCLQGPNHFFDFGLQLSFQTELKTEVHFALNLLNLISLLGQNELR